MSAPAGVHHVAILVRDLPGAEVFYRQVLGLPVLRRWPSADGGGERSVWLDLGGGAFLALERTTEGAAAAEPEQAPGLHLLALRIAAAARGDWEARLVAAGVRVTHRTAYTLYFQDPEGNRVGLSHWPDEAAG
jgi:catechol 2,3-dioxygenase-like lactoylglutathione lyase family enzyme